MAKPKVKTGRPATLEVDPEVANVIVGLLQEGNFLETAASFAGADPQAVRRWIREGARDIKKGIESARATFSAACARAKSASEAADMRFIGGSDDWKARAWKRKVLDPLRFGDQQKVEMSGGLSIKREIIGATPEDI